MLKNLLPGPEPVQMEKNIKFSRSSVRKITIRERSKGRMQINIKLNKESAVQWKQLCNQLLPTGMSEDEFAFFCMNFGAALYNRNQHTKAAQMAKDEPDKLREAGLDPEEYLKHFGHLLDPDTPEVSVEDIMSASAHNAQIGTMQSGLDSFLAGQELDDVTPDALAETVDEQEVT